MSKANHRSKRSARSLAPLSYLCQRAHDQPHSPPYHRWFGIIILPLVSFSADGAVAIVFFIRSSLQRFFTAPQPPDILAEARAIDMSIQFLLFWMPLVTLLGWCLNKPMSMLFGNKETSPHLVQKADVWR
jgi:Ca2+/H+ antiporter